MADEYLVEGAMLICVNGGSPVFLKIPNGHGYLSGGKEKANCGDCIACDNIPYFGICMVNKETHLCEGYMTLKEKWENKSVSLSKPEMVDGKEALTMDSVLFCQKGGIILPVTSGQGDVKGINLWELLKQITKLILWSLGKNFVNRIYGGEPINMNTGNFVHEKEDLLIAGKTRISFRTFYNAMEYESEGSMGEGWHHNFELRIKKEENGKFIYVCLGDGRKIPYREGMGNELTSVFGDRGSLRKETGGYLYADGKGMQYLFDVNGLISVRQDKNGNEDIFVHDGQGQLIKVWGANGGSLSYTYNGEGKLIRVEDNIGRTVHLWYRYGKLWKIENALGHAYVYEYNENGKMESSISPCGIMNFKNEYDMADRVVQQTLPDGGCIELKYDDANMRTYKKDANGAITVYDNDERLRNIRTTLAEGEEYYEYNDRNQRTLRVDRNGNKTKYRYNTSGNLIKIENAMGKCVCVEYDGNGNRTSVYLPEGPGISYLYDNNGNVLEKKDPLGHVTRISRNGVGQPETVTLPDESQIHMEYDARGNVSCITDMLGNHIFYEYDAINRITGVTDGRGNVTNYIYDAKSRLIKLVNAVGNVREFIYNEDGEMTEAIDYDGCRIKIAYGENGKKKSFQDKEGNVTLYDYDLNGNLKEMKMPNGGIRHYEYDSRNQLIAYVNEMGEVSKYEYDKNGNRIKLITPTGEEMSFAYDKINRLIRTTEPDGAETVFVYNEQSRLAEIIYPGGICEKAAYDAGGRKIWKQDVYGNIVKCSYNAIGGPEEMEDPWGGKTVRVYYPGGLLKSVLYPDGAGESYDYDGNRNMTVKRRQDGYAIYYTYDKLNRVTGIRNSIGEEMSFSYNRIGQIVKVMCGEKTVREFEYSPNGNMLSESDAYGCRRIYTYDCMGKLIRMSQKDGQGKERNAISYERDLCGRIVSVTDSLGNKETYEYDRRGRIIRKTDREGYETVYSYNKSGKRESIRYGDGRTIKYKYDSRRHLIGAEDGDSEIRIQTDIYGRIEAVIDGKGKTVRFEYGKNSEKISLTYPDGEKVLFRYDKLGRLEEMIDGKDVISYCYDQSGRLAGRKIPGGMESVYTYCANGRLEELTHNAYGETEERFLYSYNAAGLKSVIRKERKGMPHEAGMFSYGYDDAGRIRTVSRNGNLLREYGYDGFGNRSYLKEDGSMTEYQYNVMNQLICKTVTKQSGERINYGYKYDRRGNITEISRNGKRLFSYVFGADNRLKEACNEIGDKARYQYDALGNRIVKETTYAGGNTAREEYLLDQTKCCRNLLGMETDGKKQRFIWDGNVACMEENGTKSYFLQDEMGSPVRLMWKNGKRRESYSYDEFGRGHVSAAQPFGYTGYQSDEISGTYYAQAREYHAADGRFIGEDPVHGNANWYIYGSGNPLKYCDPMGLEDYVTDEDADLAPEWLERMLDGIMNGPGLIGDMLRQADVWTRNGDIDELLSVFGFDRHADGDFHVRQKTWQQFFGYNSLYDFTFDAGTSMDFQMFPFKTADGEEYVIWMWKGDYLNLGAGAETGIYKDPIFWGFHWQAAVDDALPMTLTVKYDGEEIINYSPEEPQWWITGFDPAVPDVSANDLQVEGSISFEGEQYDAIWEGFLEKYKGKEEEYNIIIDETSKKLLYSW